eukprot:3165551-Rhodomonas_salina.1
MEDGEEEEDGDGEAEEMAQEGEEGAKRKSKKSIARAELEAGEEVSPYAPRVPHPLSTLRLRGTDVAYLPTPFLVLALHMLLGRCYAMSSTDARMMVPATRTHSETSLSTLSRLWPPEPEWCVCSNATLDRIIDVLITGALFLCGVVEKGNVVCYEDTRASESARTKCPKRVFALFPMSCGCAACCLRSVLTGDVHTAGVMDDEDGSEEDEEDEEDGEMVDVDDDDEEDEDEDDDDDDDDENEEEEAKTEDEAEKQKAEGGKAGEDGGEKEEESS